MIFVTVGTQLPFDRLIDAMDALASTLDEEIVAQVGPVASPGRWTNIRARTQFDPPAFVEEVTRCRVIVGHAGVGTVLTARSYGRPLVVLPRRHALGEHRNDHQVATARHLETLPGVSVAWDAADIGPLLQRRLQPAASPETSEKARLIARLASELG